MAQGLRFECQLRLHGMRPARVAETAAYCPGIGKGPLVQIQTAWQEAAEMRESYPALY